jgi:RHS repeat-associated protein
MIDRSRKARYNKSEVQGAKSDRIMAVIKPPRLDGNSVVFSEKCDQSVVRYSLQYNRARYYDPSIGRWISQDPLGFEAGDSNLYRYVNNRPTATTDASGLQAATPTPTPTPMFLEKKSSALTGNNGAFLLWARFELSSKSDKNLGGYLITQITAEQVKVSNKDGAVKGYNKTTWDRRSLNFYIAGRVYPDSTEVLRGTNVPPLKGKNPFYVFARDNFFPDGKKGFVQFAKFQDENRASWWWMHRRLAKKTTGKLKLHVTYYYVDSVNELDSKVWTTKTVTPATKAAPQTTMQKYATIGDLAKASKFSFKKIKTGPSFYIYVDWEQGGPTSVEFSPGP